MSVFGQVLVHVGTVLFFASVIVRGAQSGAYPEIRPVDEASQQADIFTFRAHLQAAIGRHDSAAVLSVVNVNIRNTFDGDNGREAFERLWRLESPDTELWEKLGSALALGGTFEANGTFVAPYTADDSNVASWRIIERNGGRREPGLFVSESGALRRYSLERKEIP